jgi:hypothetical protein
MEMSNASFRPAAVLLLLFATSGAPASHIRGQQVPSPAPRGHVLGGIVYDGDLAGLLQHLAVEFGITIGFEADHRQPRPRVKFELREATLQNVLDAIVRAQPAYQWRQEGGFVDVYPLKGGSPLLDTVIGHFQVSAANWAEASDALLSLPEVQASVSANRLGRREAVRGATGRSGDVFSLYVENVPVRRALHEIAKRSGSHLWVFRQYADREKSFSLGNSSR